MFVCKIHTKKSPHRTNGEEWREQLMVPLLESVSQVKRVLEKFKVNPMLGLLVPIHSLVDLSDYEIHSDNVKWLDLLLTRLDKTTLIGTYNFTFPAGSMYWFRVAALSQLLNDQFVSLQEFEYEAGQLDGTLAHAIERLISFLAISQGYEIEEISPNE